MSCWYPFGATWTTSDGARRGGRGLRRRLARGITCAAAAPRVPRRCPSAGRRCRRSPRCTSRVSPRDRLVLNVANRHRRRAREHGVRPSRRCRAGGSRSALGAGGSLATPYADEQVALGRPVGSDTERRRDVEARDRADPRALGPAIRPASCTPPRRLPIVVAGFGPKMAGARGPGRRRLQHRRGPRAAPFGLVAASARSAHAKCRGARRRSRDQRVRAASPAPRAGRKRLAPSLCRSTG